MLSVFSAVPNATPTYRLLPDVATCETLEFLEYAEYSTGSWGCFHWAGNQFSLRLRSCPVAVFGWAWCLHWGRWSSARYWTWRCWYFNSGFLFPWKLFREGMPRFGGLHYFPAFWCLEFWTFGRRTCFILRFAWKAPRFSSPVVRTCDLHLRICRFQILWDHFRSWVLFIEFFFRPRLGYI